MSVTIETTMTKAIMKQSLPKAIVHSPVVITNAQEYGPAEPLAAQMESEVVAVIAAYIGSLIMAPRAPNVVRKISKKNKSPEFCYSLL